MGIKVDLQDNGKSLCYRCQGCKHLHVVRIDAKINEDDQHWSWNGSYEAPTFHPSILERRAIWPNYDDEAEYDKLAAQGSDVLMNSRFGTRCHSWVRDGKVEFLSDCTHALAGQTLDIPDWIK